MYYSVKIYLSLDGRHLRFVEKFDEREHDFEETVFCSADCLYKVLRNYYLARKAYQYRNPYKVADMDLHLRAMIDKFTTYSYGILG